MHLQYIYGESCPLCSKDLRSETTIETISKYYANISSDLQSEITIEHDSALKKGKNTKIDIRAKEPPTDKIIYKIYNKLLEIYGENFKYVTCAESPDKYFIVCQDYNHSKTYFSAWFDTFLFDKKGNLLTQKQSFINGRVYSDFFIDDTDFDGTNLE